MVEPSSINFGFKNTRQSYKDAFYVKAPSKSTAAMGLPNNFAAMCLVAQQAPLNPHAQRLVSAAARGAKVDPEKASPNAPKAKAKAKGKARAKAKAKVQVSEGKSAAEIYSKAKKDFFDGFLATFGRLTVLILNNFVTSKVVFFEPHALSLCRVFTSLAGDLATPQHINHLRLAGEKIPQKDKESRRSLKLNDLSQARKS